MSSVARSQHREASLLRWRGQGAQKRAVVTDIVAIVVWRGAGEGSLRSVRVVAAQVERERLTFTFCLESWIFRNIRLNDQTQDLIFFFKRGNRKFIDGRDDRTRKYLALAYVEQVFLNICSLVVFDLSAAARCGKSCCWRGGDTHGPISENSGLSTAVWEVINAGQPLKITWLLVKENKTNQFFLAINGLIIERRFNSISWVYIRFINTLVYNNLKM